MGYIATSLGSDRNDTQAYQAYTEYYGIGTNPYLRPLFANIPINQDMAVYVEVTNTGMGNQFQAQVEDKNGTWWTLNQGDLYYPAAHVAAHSETLA